MVDATTITDAMREKLKDHSGDESVDALSIPGTLLEVEVAYTVLLDSRAIAKKWRYGVDLATKQSEYEVLVKRYQDRVKLLADFDSALEQAPKTQSKKDNHQEDGDDGRGATPARCAEVARTDGGKEGAPKRAGGPVSGVFL